MTIVDKVKAAPKTLAIRTMEVARNLNSILGFGMQFQGARDLSKTYGYPYKVAFQQAWGKYERQDIARRIVDAPANAIWTRPPKISKMGTFEGKFQDFTKKFNLWQVLNRADKLAGMGPYSAILMGLNDGQKDLGQPVKKGTKLDIIYLQPFSCATLRVAELESDQTSERFGKPKIYQLQAPDITTQNTGMGSIMQNLPSKSQKVHYSRVIHIADNPIESDTAGTPRLVTVYNLLDDLLKVGGGSAEVYWLNSRGGMHIDIDKELDLGADESSLDDEISEYINDLRRVIRTRGTKVNMLNSTVNDPSTTFRVLIALISAATGIPQRILIGAEAGQLSSEQDRANWATVIEERREDFAWPCILKPFFLKMNDLGFIQTREEIDGYELEWPEAFLLSPLERSQTSAQQARSAANLSKAMIQTPTLVSVTESRAIIAGRAPQLTMDPDQKVPTGDQVREEDTVAGQKAVDAEIAKSQPQQPFGGGGA